jgi:type III secretion protein J
MQARTNPAITITTLLCIILLLSGCYQELYTDQPEQQINEMMALLEQDGISCKKTTGLEGTWSLQVDGDKVSAAMNVLHANGFPRKAFENMGRVFEKKGLISSPTEERIRFIYALSQEISDTIASIHGVLDARVHIVLPENNPLADKLIPSSAAVFIKQKPGIDLESQTMKIKELVVNSIQGLEFKNVTVALFQTPVNTSQTSPTMYVSLLGFKLAPESADRFRWLMVVLVSLAGSILMAIVIVLFKRKFGWSRINSLQSGIRQKISAAKKLSE